MSEARYLVDSQIKSMHNNLFISGYDQDKIHSISYDLTVKDIIVWKLKENIDLEVDVENKIEKRICQIIAYSPRK